MQGDLIDKPDPVLIDRIDLSLHSLPFPLAVRSVRFRKEGLNLLHRTRSLSGRTGLLVTLLVLFLVILIGYEKYCRQFERVHNGIYRDLENTVAELDRDISIMLLQIRDLEQDSRRTRDQKITALETMLQPVLEDLSQQTGFSLGYYSHTLESCIATSPESTMHLAPGTRKPDPSAVEVCLQGHFSDSPPPVSLQKNQIHYTLPVYRQGQPVGLIGATFPKSHCYQILWSNLPVNLGQLLVILAAGILCALYIAHTIRATTALFDAHLDSFGDNPSDHVVPAAVAGNIPKEFVPLYQKYSQMMHRIQEQAQELSLSVRLSAFGEMIMVVAHEIRNPLAVIKAAAEIGKTSTDLKHQLQLFNQIDDVTENINTLLNRYLTLARDPSNITEAINVQLVLEKVLSMLEPVFKRKEIRLKSSYPPEPPQIVGDSLALEQALMNLLINAVEASPQQGLITLDLFSHAGTVELHLSDSGPGIPDAIRHQVFDRFFTTKGNRGVGGVGLALASNIIHKHGGKIWFKSEKDYGTTFYILLPIAPKYFP